MLYIFKYSSSVPILIIRGTKRHLIWQTANRPLLTPNYIKVWIFKSPLGTWPSSLVFKCQLKHFSHIDKTNDRKQIKILTIIGEDTTSDLGTYLQIEASSTSTEVDNVVTTSPDVLNPEQRNSNTSDDVSGQSKFITSFVWTCHSKMGTQKI